MTPSTPRRPDADTPPARPADHARRSTSAHPSHADRGRRRAGLLAAGLLAAIVLTGPLDGRAQEPAGEEVTAAQFDRWMTELSNWGRWGDDDQLGALNLITAEKRVEAARLVEAGRTVSMARPLPVEPREAVGEAGANRPPVLVGSARNVFDIDTDNGYFWERYEIEYHGLRLTHLDALCHVAYEGRVYNGRPFEEVATTDDGCTEVGIGNLRDGIVTRGVLVDLPGRSVRRQDLEAWEAETGVTITAGDALFLRTGRDVDQAGGYHPSLIPFLKERDVALLGSDVAQEGGEVEGVAIPIHVFTLVALGVHLFDNLGLEELARTAAELDRWEFMFMASPHVMPNGAGAALNPIGVF